MKWPRTDGFSLISVLVTVAVMAVVMVGWLQMNSSISKGQRQLAQMDDLAGISRLVGVVMGNPSACKKSFSNLIVDGTPHDVTLRQSDGTPILGTGKFSLNVEVLSVKVSAPLPTKAVEVAQAELQVELKKTANNTGATRTLNIPFNVWLGLGKFWKCAYPGEPASGHVIFVTRNNYTGNLGGLSGADTVCQTEASAAGWGTNWRALLGSSTVAARDRVTVAGPVFNTVGDLLAENSYDLYDGRLNKSVGYMLNTHADNHGGPVFTGSSKTGTLDVSHSVTETWCNDWTSASGTLNSGNLGNSNRTDSNWLSVYTGFISNPCDNRYPFYCINQWAP